MVDSLVLFYFLFFGCGWGCLGRVWGMVLFTTGGALLKTHQRFLYRGFSYFTFLSSVVLEALQKQHRTFLVGRAWRDMHVSRVWKDCSGRSLCFQAFSFFTGKYCY